uniref:RNA-editing substrate-binding complex 8 protein HEAT repeats domain-containing protein n=1 Tax=Pyrodinium bahamense TaxID=73915 RepID=A0A7S0BAJ5_9DINO
MSPRNLSDLLWACSRLDIFDSELFNEVISDATRRLEMYTAQGISLLVFALGYVGQRPRAVFMQALVRELRSRIDKEFDPQAISNVVYGMMRLGIRDDRLMKIVSEHLLRTGFDEFESLPLVCIASAYAKLECWNERLFASLGRSVIERLNDLPPRLVVMSALCFAQSTAALEESSFIMESILKGVEPRLNEFTNRDLSTISFAAGKFRQLSEAIDHDKPRAMYEAKDPFAKEVIEQVDRRTFESFTMQEMNLITYGLMRLQHRDEKFLLKAANQFVKNAAELTSVEIVNALYAFGRLEFVHLQFVHAMVEEVRRRNLVPEMTNLEMATLAYSLGLCRISVEEIMDAIAVQVVGRARECSGQGLAMVLWSMAVVNAKTHAEPLVSACLEEVSARGTQFDSSSISIIFWSSAILSGTASAVWALKIFFMPGFWSQGLDERSYAMIYHMYAALRAEAGLAMEELDGWYMCRRIYEEITGANIGQQNQRLSQRLRMQTIAHLANAMVPALEGFPEAGVRADIVIEKLQLIIEVEGPMRNVIPLDKAVAAMAEIEGEEGKEICGRTEEVIAEVRSEIECGLTGSAAFKRRLLRKCGWRVVTVSFDENEEYIADALCKMAEKKEKQDDGVDQEAEGDAEDDDAGAQGSFDEPAAATAPDVAAMAGDSFAGGISLVGDEVVEKEQVLSEYEKKVRAKLDLAVEELQRRILEERGNAAASSLFSNHLEYRRWQVGLEKDVIKEMLDSF